MCNKCKQRGLDRRSFLAVGGAGVFMSALLSAGLRNALAAAGPSTALTPDQALDALRSGNQRYLNDPQVCQAELAQRRQEVAPHQAPWATVLSCADSRVPPELIFGGLGLGELFIARNAGNLADTATLGTVEYGAAVLGSPVIVVLAHTRCGAVAAACDVVTKDATFPGVIGNMIEPILPAAIAAKSEAGDFITNAAKQSARRTADRIGRASSLIAGLVDAGKLKIVAAIYDLESGEVAYL
jgi:carbonic anhydrase